MAKVVFRTPDGKVREVRLKQRNTLGRHPAQDIQILDRVVSKAHAVIESQDTRYFLYDVGSRNGTVLNGQPLTRRTELRTGDEITLGSTCLQFRADPPPKPAGPPEPPTFTGGGGGGGGRPMGGGPRRGATIMMGGGSGVTIQ